MHCFFSYLFTLRISRQKKEKKNIQAEEREKKESRKKENRRKERWDGGGRKKEGQSVYLKRVNRYLGKVEKQTVLDQYKASCFFFSSFLFLFWQSTKQLLQ